MAVLDPAVVSSFSVSVEPTDDAVVVVVRGELDLATKLVLEDALFALSSVPISQVVVDMAELVFMDASSLSILLIACEGQRARGVDFVLRSVHGLPRRVLELTGVAQVLRVSDE